MKTWHIIRARWKNHFSHKRQFLALLFIPLLVLWGADQLLKTGSTQIQIPIVFVVEEESDTATTLIERISDKEAIHAIKRSKEEAKRLLETNQAESAIIFKENIEEKLKNGEIEGVIELWESPSAISVGLIEEFVASEVIRLASNGKAATYLAENLDGDKIYEEAWAFADGQWEPEPLMTIDYKTAGESALPSPEPSSSSNKSSSLLYGILSVYILLISFFLHSWVLENRSNGVASRSGMFGVSRFTQLAGNFFGTVAFTAFTLIPVSIFMLSTTDEVYLLLAYLFASMGIGFFLNHLFTSRSLYQLVAIAFTVVTSIIGGTFIKLAEFSKTFASATTYTPQHWFLEGLAQDPSTSLLILISIGVGTMILGFGTGAIRHD
ncbi:ABC transporter permease [Alkalihalobacillus sp. AL-G]|uniref:ABC transporter permease n=1 Tax=Alkalihalobacillus sp. AL-G TaxID=2926399 RepID=UPI00272DA206|nr:ABC transporter permease [Alkalihalobacillus sp. AL-G]WLD93042.1 ABC transporter permease [Alkalihalobacillus sp. AL-G]